MLAPVADRQHPHGEIDWASSAVEDAALTVDLTGAPNAAWARGLRSIIERLSRSSHAWGEIKVTQKRLTVASLTAGCETDLRHFLDSAVLQVNTNFAPAEDQDAEDDAGRSQADREMTEAFRSFSDGDKDGDVDG
jgi:hypothetical protein